jgi:hypothetical protein
MSGRIRTSFIVAAAAAVALSAANTGAGAVTDRVRASCQSDYYKFCPAYSVGTPELRQCMRSVGKRLSAKCIDALVASGEIKRPR